MRSFQMLDNPFKNMRNLGFARDDAGKKEESMELGGLTLVFLRKEILRFSN